MWRLEWCTAWKRQSRGTLWYARCSNGLREVRDEHGDQELRPHRQRLDRRLERGECGERCDRRRRRGDRDQHELHQHVAHEEIRQVRAPPVAQRRQSAHGEHALDRDEHQRREEQRDHEPVQAERVRRRFDAIEVHGRAAAAARRAPPTAHAEQRHAAAAAAQDRHRAQHEGRDQADQQQVAREVLGVGGAELAAGEQLRKVEAQHAHQRAEPEAGGNVGQPGFVRSHCVCSPC